MNFDDMNFDEDTIESFIQNGYVHYPSAINSDLIDRCRNWMINEIDLNMEDPDSWTESVVRIGGSRDHSFWEVMNHPNMLRGYDALAGEGRWKNPVQGTGSFPIRFPSEEDPGDAGWHIDGSFTVDDDFHVTLDSKERCLLMLILFSDVSEQDAPTRIRRGSHLLVPKAFRADEPTVSYQEIVPRLPTSLDSLPIDLAVGKAGDVYFCHPFLVHAASFPHRGVSPRFISQPGLAPALPSPDAPYSGLITNGRLDLNRQDGDYSPVEQAIRMGLGA